MNNVPKMVSSKDLDFISDMLNWNYFAVKECFNFSQIATDNEIKDELNEVGNMHYEHYKFILNLLK